MISAINGVVFRKRGGQGGVKGGGQKGTKGGKPSRPSVYHATMKNNYAKEGHDPMPHDHATGHKRAQRTLLLW